MREGKRRDNGIRRQNSEGEPRLCAKGDGAEHDKKGREKKKKKCIHIMEKCRGEYTRDGGIMVIELQK